MRDIQQLLKQYYGYDSLRPGQEEIIGNLLAGRDVLAVMPTGAGKSLCFQLPALASDGITLVISPLISLMQDQVRALVQAGVSAAYFNSALTERQYDLALERARQGRYKLIYVAPERLNTPRFLSFVHSAHIAFVAVDEAHCVSHWGPDFRPSYLEIPDFLRRLGRRPPVGAFTATATPEVREDIARQLSLVDPALTVTGFDRPNLNFEVQMPTDKRGRLLALVRSYGEQSGVVYCSTRKGVEEVTELLREHGVSAGRYHAGLEAEERQKNQEDFLFDRIRVMVATNAFGMGIDKSDVRYVIHYNMPKDLESYYQEAGRAGRDGERADCILLYGKGDVRTARFLIENSEARENLEPEEADRLRERELERLKVMVGYCQTGECLRQYILRYFGERCFKPCGSCGNCRQRREEIDVTAEGRQALSVVRESGQRFGRTAIAEVLRGGQSDRILRWRLNRLESYGALAARSSAWVYQLLDRLLEGGYLALSEGEYPVLTLTENSPALFQEEGMLTMLQPRESRPSPVQQEEREVDDGLFQRLRQLRLELARRRGVPPYAVFTDRTLREMCQKLPATSQELAQVSGVGWKKLDDYGAQFLTEIAAYRRGD